MFQWGRFGGFGEHDIQVRIGLVEELFEIQVIHQHNAHDCGEAGEAWNQVQLVDADIYMPKVSMTTSGEITSEIMGAGLPLDKITYNNVCKTVSEVTAYQGFNMTLDENGTVIKAAGAVVAGDGAMIAPRDELRINRPFIFGVYEVSSRVFLGLGIINQPDK